VAFVRGRFATPRKVIAGSPETSYKGSIIYYPGAA
jgi:hypothetical protein